MNDLEFYYEAHKDKLYGFPITAFYISKYFSLKNKYSIARITYDSFTNEIEESYRLGLIRTQYFFDLESKKWLVGFSEDDNINEKLLWQTYIINREIYQSIGADRVHFK